MKYIFLIGLVLAIPDIGFCQNDSFFYKTICYDEIVKRTDTSDLLLYNYIYKEIDKDTISFSTNVVNDSIKTINQSVLRAIDKQIFLGFKYWFIPYSELIKCIYLDQYKFFKIKNTDIHCFVAKYLIVDKGTLVVYGVFEKDKILFANIDWAPADKFFVDFEFYEIKNSGNTLQIICNIENISTPYGLSIIEFNPETHTVTISSDNSNW